jgi:hypothetical protein
MKLRVSAVQGKIAHVESLDKDMLKNKNGVWALLFLSLSQKSGEKLIEHPVDQPSKQSKIR